MNGLHRSITVILDKCDSHYAKNRKNQLVEQEFLLEQENLILSRMVYCQSTVFEIDDCTLGIRVADHFKIILNILAMDRLLSVQGLFRIMFLIV